MKKCIMIILTGYLMLFCACSRGSFSDSLRKNAVDLASDFAANRIDSAILITDDQGVVSAGDEIVRYIIDPASVFFEEIDEEPGKEVWVTIDSLHDPYLVPAWHLVMKKSGRDLVITDSIRSDMKVLLIEKGIITASVPTHKPSSPLYYCSECRDTVTYRISGGRLVLRNNPVLN